MTPQALEPRQLRVQCNPNDFEFETTVELDTLDQVVGQDRASDALYFGIDVRHEGYNLYVIGQAGVGKYSVVRKALQAQAVKQAILS